MATKKIPVHKLKVGMFVEELDRHWLDSPFWFHKKKMKDQKDIDEFIKSGIKTIIINTDKGIDIEEESILDQQEKDHLSEKTKIPQLTYEESVFTDPVPFTEELPRAKEIKNNVSNVVKNIFNDVRMGKAIELNDVKTQVNGIVECVFRNRDALLCLANLKDYDNYTFVHSVNICILSVSFARHLNLPKTHLEHIGLGALLHDLGKTQIPESILNKPGKYTPEEYNIMKGHVGLGVEILRKHDNIPAEAMMVVLQHHERYNGCGYPQKLYGDKIDLIGQIAGISDVYDAITYDRVYHKALSCHSAVKRLYEWNDTLFNRSLIEKFIQCIGIYPVGSFVELNTGHRGLVISVNHQILLRPKVLVLFEGDKRLDSPFSIDPAIEDDEKCNFKYSIERELDPEDYEVDINQYLDRFKTT